MALYLEYYLSTKLPQIAEDWRDLGKYNEENAPDIILQTVYVLVKQDLVLLTKVLFDVKFDSKEKYNKLCLSEMIMK